MKFSYRWIQEFIDGLDMPAEALERLITMKTAECEGVETAGELLGGAVAARIEQVQPIAGSKNVQALVATERYGKKTVVCGAENCRPGLLTAYVPLGVKKIAGVLSDGMLASASELGINRDHAGIVELQSPADLPHPDSIIDIDNKSITHRPDLWGHYGMAREVAAITGKTLIDRVRMDLLPPAGAPIEVAVADHAGCPRFSAFVFENVTVKPSPLWLQFRLTSLGLNSINNVVDVSNYIMAELAQPTHAYDRHKLHGNTIFIRRAQDGEHFVGLNKESYSLNASNLVIADGNGAIGLAGVIGGLDSSIGEGTTEIVFESANFNAGLIRRTSSAMKLRTDASMRFEKAQDPENTVRALARALELLPLVSPGIRLVGGLADERSLQAPPSTISLNLPWLAKKLGRVLDAGEVRSILEALQFGVTESGKEHLTVSVPSWRATKDVSMPEDLVEEVGRMIGYSTIEPKPPLVPCAPTFDPPEREFLRTVRRNLTAQGFTEVSNYSFISEEEAARFGFNLADHVRVLNPIAEGQELMRTSLLPGIHRNILENAKHFEQFRIFEMGREIHKSADKPDEHPHLMAAIYAKDDGRASLLELKRVVECLATTVHIRPAETALPWQHPTRTAALWWQGQQMGYVCELHPLLMESGRAAVLDIDLTLLQQLTPETAKYRPVRRFPTSAFDLSIVTEARVIAATLELQIRQHAGELAEAIEYVREYRGAPLPEGKKSVSFRIVAGAADRTLSSEEIASLRQQIIEGLSADGYELRV